MGLVVILDGYNVIHRVPELRSQMERSLESGRAALVRCCQDWMSARGDVSQFWIVFDGAGNAGESPSGAVGVRILFSRKGETADERILAIMEEVGRYSRYTVVSDDRAVMQGAKGLGASVMSADAFFGTARKRARPAAGSADDGKLSVREQRLITDSLKREWGIE